VQDGGCDDVVELVVGERQRLADVRYVPAGVVTSLLWARWTMVALASKP
jgi:hypothetical protein